MIFTLPVARKDRLLKTIELTQEISLTAPDTIRPIMFDTPMTIITRLKSK